LTALQDDAFPSLQLLAPAKPQFRITVTYNIPTVSNIPIKLPDKDLLSCLSTGTSFAMSPFLKHTDNLPHIAISSPLIIHSLINHLEQELQN
jgi:hypothetical protein